MSKRRSTASRHFAAVGVVHAPVADRGYGSVLTFKDPDRIQFDDIGRLRRFEKRFAQLNGELAAHDIPETIQHDDLHAQNVYANDGLLRVLDWGDSSISHPFMSLVVTFRFLEETNGLKPSDPWFARLRDAYLEPWGRGLEEAFALAIRVGSVAHAIAWLRQRDALAPQAHADFDRAFRIILRRAIAQTSV